ncbi:MAG TPA: hypothetical protein VM243_21040 [Phycisphaerae bacterium]|nr:hypothetical protein [Phycisphaerae bacterium]
MHFRRLLSVGILILALCAAWALALQQGDASSGSREPVYRVTPWPENTPERPYYQEVERYLNRMAADGWRLHTEVAAQGARMMVFERDAER